MIAKLLLFRRFAWVSGLLLSATCAHGELVAGDTFEVSPEAGGGRDLILDLSTDASLRQSGGRLEYTKWQKDSQDNVAVLHTRFMGQGTLLLRVHGAHTMDAPPTALTASIPDLKLPERGSVKILVECRPLKSPTVETQKTWLAIAPAASPRDSLCSVELSSTGAASFRNGSEEVSPGQVVSAPQAPLTLVIELRDRSLAGFEIQNTAAGTTLAEASFPTRDKLPEEIAVTMGVAADSSDADGLADLHVLSIRVEKE